MNKADLQHGHYYKGRCRNATIARWNADEDCFYHHRTKFGMTFVECILHPDDEDVWDMFVVECECEPDKPIPFKFDEE